jgi:hypothetical protein
MAGGLRDALTWARVRAGLPAPTRSGTAFGARQPSVVDVLMPYYGDVGMMQEAVRSVLAQTDPHWRLTVVDDGVEPGVPEWFAGLIAQHGPDKIRYQRNEANLGITGNFQKCLSLVTHPLVTMIGSDDRMLPEYIRTVRALMRDYPRVSLAQPGVEVIDGNGEVVEPWVDKVKRRVYAPSALAPSSSSTPAEVQPPRLSIRDITPRSLIANAPGSFSFPPRSTCSGPATGYPPSRTVQPAGAVTRWTRISAPAFTKVCVSISAPPTRLSTPPGVSSKPGTCRDAAHSAAAPIGSIAPRDVTRPSGAISAMWLPTRFAHASGAVSGAVTVENASGE